MTVQPTEERGPITAPEDPREVASKVDLAPIAGAVVASWLLVAPSFVHYPTGAAGQDVDLRDRYAGLVMLFAAICWARARRHRRRFLALYALVALWLVVQAVLINTLSGTLSTPAWNELVIGIAGLLVAAGGWRSAGRDRPPPADTSDLDNERNP